MSADQLRLPGRELPKRVALVAMGPSCQGYVQRMKHQGSPYRQYDEVWTVNGMCQVIHGDRLFLMDDLEVQELRAQAGNRYVQGLLQVARTHPGPIYTARQVPGYSPGLMEYPLQWVLNSTGSAYLKNSVPYMVALAVAMGSVEHLGIYGCDYTYSGIKAEEGRANLEFWCGLAVGQGMEVAVPHDSTLLDGGVGAPYGYWAQDMEVKRNGDGTFHVKRSPRNRLPTAAEMERMMK